MAYVTIKNHVFQEQLVIHYMILIWCGYGMGEERYAKVPEEEAFERSCSLAYVVSLAQINS